MSSNPGDDILSVVSKFDLRKPFMFDATQSGLEYFFLLCVCVAGKKAIIQKERLDQFIEATVEKTVEGTIVERYDALENSCHKWILDTLKKVKLGRYKVLYPSFLILGSTLKQNPQFLRQGTREELMTIPGVGYKTSSYFLMYTRVNPGVACLDRHIVRYMVRMNILPENYLAGSLRKDQYLKVEKAFLDYCKVRNRKPFELDIEIWNENNKSYN